MLQKSTANQEKVEIIYEIDINRTSQSTAKIIKTTRLPEIPFVLKNEFIYHVNNEKKLRLYISSNMKQKIFKQVHDLSNHEKYHKCHDKLSHTIFIRYLSKNLRVYIIYCFAYQLNQTKKYKLYGELVFIVISIIFFHTIAMNFVITLSLIKTEHDCIFTMICKFNKKNFLVIGKKT